MTATRRKYTAKQRAAAVGIAGGEGGRGAGEAVGGALWVGVQVAINEVTKALRGAAPPHQKAAALAVLYDRYALMTGQATSRSENRTLTEGLDDHERDALRRLLEEAIEAASAD